MQPTAMTLLLFLSLALFAWSATRRYALLRVGTSEPRFSVRSWPQLITRLRNTVVYAFGQKKMPRYRLAGYAHMLIFFGFMVLLLRTLVLWGRGYDPDFDFWGVLARGTVTGDVYSLLKDVFVVLVILGASVFVYYRVVARKHRMSLGFEGLLILGIIITMMLADVLYDGALIALAHTVSGADWEFTPWEPAGSVAALALTNVDPAMLELLAHVGFWWHVAFVLVFLNILPYSKHFHVITAIPNVFSQSSLPRGTLPALDDLEGKVEREEALGFHKIEDLSWKDMLDLYTCTECGRCSDQCPAYVTDKKLSPKHLTMALRDHLYDSEARLLSDNGIASLTDLQLAHKAPTKIELGGTAPRGAYFRSGQSLELVPQILHPDVIWACTTCRACEEECPVNISYVDKIVKLRRHQVMMESEFPSQLQKAFQGTELNGNPWNLSAADRSDWTAGLEIPTVDQNPEADVLYWVGCAVSYDDRAKRIARATARLLQQAQVNFAILGNAERCTGDPARRAGNEYLFQIMAQTNIETLKAAGAERQKIITTCPHCFNTLLNEYPQFGAQFEVVHHTDYLLELLQQRRLVAHKPVNATVAFHDSCYLGRYNDIYESPREILAAIPGVQLREVPQASRSRGLCCGAGGAQMFMEEQNENRVNNKRTLQLLNTGADTVATACPFCMTMMHDGIKAHEKEETVANLDVAEVLERSVF